MRLILVVLTLALLVRYAYWQNETHLVTLGMRQEQVHMILKSAWHIDKCKPHPADSMHFRELFWYGHKDVSSPKLFFVSYEKSGQSDWVVIGMGWEEEYLITWFDGDCTTLDLTPLYAKYDRTPIPRTMSASP